MRPALRFLRNDRAVFATTLMFMFANVGEGMMIVVIPVYAREVLGGGAGTYGLMLSAFALAATAGAAIIGGIAWRRPLGRSIAASQPLAGMASAAGRLPGLMPAAGTLALAGCSARRSRSGRRPCGCGTSPMLYAAGCSVSCAR